MLDAAVRGMMAGTPASTAALVFYFFVKNLQMPLWARHLRDSDCGGEWLEIDFLDNASRMLAIPCAINTRLCSSLSFYFQPSGQGKANNNPRL